jgi:hypothetical protein
MDIPKINNAFKSKLPSSQRVADDTQFKQIFDRNLNKIDAPTAPAPANGQIDVIEHGDKILNMLDDFARVLSRPEKTLKEIEPLALDIEKEARLIEAEAAENIPDDSELGKIIQDLAVTANVAVLKFHRGDYI